jgi:predicted transposase/invertase (TIGR01784 family)
MPLFNKKEHELETQFDKWLFFLKNLETFDHIPAVLNEPVFKQGFEIARLANMDAKERQQYNYNAKKYLDMMNAIRTTAKENLEKGHALGISEGIEKGVKKVAINALKRGLILEEIAAITGLTISEIKKLKAELKEEAKS